MMTTTVSTTTTMTLFRKALQPLIVARVVSMSALVVLPFWYRLGLVTITTTTATVSTITMITKIMMTAWTTTMTTTV